MKKPIGPYYTCQCGSGEPSWWQLDAKGIPLVRVCNKCKERRLKQYRPEVIYDPNYSHEEPMDDE